MYAKVNRAERFSAHRAHCSTVAFQRPFGGPPGPGNRRPAVGLSNPPRLERLKTQKPKFPAFIFSAVVSEVRISGTQKRNAGQEVMGLIPGHREDSSHSPLEKQAQEDRNERPQKPYPQTRAPVRPVEHLPSRHMTHWFLFWLVLTEALPRQAVRPSFTFSAPRGPKHRPPSAQARKSN
jgi:hypothetical protein